jgi:hypothetical protein
MEELVSCLFEANLKTGGKAGGLVSSRPCYSMTKGSGPSDSGQEG